MTLEIIMPHYDEDWAIVRPFFDMLRCQRGVDFNAFRVRIVHDGVGLFPKNLFADMPFEVIQERIPHGGVSAARNYGMSRADAEWICFCDCDDLFTHVYSLRLIIGQMNRDIDYIWTPFFVENSKDGEFQVWCKDKENIVWIHGKYFRLKWLRENRIEFPEHIDFNEDRAFCSLVNEMAAPWRRGKLTTDFPVYIWAWRNGSVTLRDDSKDRSRKGVMASGFYIVEELKRRGKPYEGMVGRTFADAYYSLHRGGQHVREDEEWFAEMCRPYLPIVEEIDVNYMNQIFQSASHLCEGEIVGNEPFTEWLDRIKRMKKAG